MGCHNTYHVDDVAIQRDHFDRNFQGTNDHDIAAAITAAIAVLLERPSPPPFQLADKREALFVLAHLVGDLHQPLHVGAVYLDQNGGQVDPDVTHTIDPVTETVGGNAIKDGSKNFHSEWDAPPTGFKVEQALDLLPLARAVPLSNSRMEEWSTAWATDTLKVAPEAFAGATLAKSADGWTIAFPNHDTYVQKQDDIKRQQLAKAGARLAQILNKVWP
jgi:S1/P1 Nuclease